MTSAAARTRGAVGTRLRAAWLESYLAVPLALVAVLLVANLLVGPSFLAPDNWAATLSIATPLILTALAATVPVLSGNGGLDLSVGPFAGFVTVLIAGEFVPHGISSPAALIPLVLVVGLVAGLANGILVAYVRLPAIIATLGTYLFYTGMSAQVLESPGGSVPRWLTRLNGSYGWFPAAAVPLVAVAIAWVLLSRTAYVRNLLAVGGDDRAAYTAGVNVAATRCWSYAIAGMLAALAGLMLTGLINSGDASVGPPYTITAITAVALGGISLGGGRGGLLGAGIGGAALFLIQNLLIFSHVSVFAQQIANGTILIVALAINGLRAKAREKRGAPSAMGSLAATANLDVAPVVTAAP